MSENKMIRLTINGKTVDVAAGTSILKAAQDNGVEIPTLCYLDGIEAFGGCRLCTVKVTKNGVSMMKPACAEACEDGAVVETNSSDVEEYRRFVLDVLLSDHLSSCFSCANHDGCRKRRSQLCAYDENCFTCGKRDECKLREYALRYGLVKSSYKTKAWPVAVDNSNTTFKYDPNRCIRCRRCQRTCEKELGASMILVLGRGRDTVIQMPENDTCRECMKCAQNCPTGALQAK